MTEWLFSNVPETSRIPVSVGLAALVLWVQEVVWLFITWRPRNHVYKDKGSFWLLALVWTSAIMLSVFDALSFRFSTFPKELAWMQFIGFPFLLLGFALRIPARLALGPACAPFVQTGPSHKLVTTGIYAVVRHPAYLGAFGQLVGMSLCLGSLVGLATAVVGGIPALAYRISIEEHALRDWFGQEYDQYVRRTTRLIPHFW